MLSQLYKRQTAAPRQLQHQHGNTTEKIAYGFGRAVLDFFARSMLQMDVHWHAPLPPGSKIIAANHPTTTDPFLLLTLTPEQTSILVTEMAFAVPGFGHYLRQAGHIPVIRERGREVVAQAMQRLKAGGIIGIFPEGALSPIVQGELGIGPPRTGVARLALGTGVPVIPVGIAPQPEHIHFMEARIQNMTETARWYMRGAYAVTVGEALTFTGSVEDYDYVRAVAGQVMERIGALAQESKRRLPSAQDFAGRLYIRKARLAAPNLPRAQVHRPSGDLPNPLQRNPQAGCPKPPLFS